MPAVLTNAVRYADPDRRRSSTCSTPPAGWCRSTPATSTGPRPQGHLAAARRHGPRPARSPRRRRAAGSGRGRGSRREAARLLADTAALADGAGSTRPPTSGVGAVHLPEAERARLRRRTTDPRPCRGALPRGAARPGQRRARCTRLAYATRPAPPPSRRALLDAELDTIDPLGLRDATSSPSPRSCDLTRDLGVRVAARGSGAGSLVNHLLGISGVDPVRHGLLMERFLSPLRAALPDIDIDVESARRIEVYERDPRPVRRRAGRVRVDDGHLPGAPRRPRRRRRARHAAGRDRRDRQGLPAHPGPRRPRRAGASCPSCAPAGARGDAAARPASSTSSRALDGLPRHVALHPCGVLLSDADAARPHPGRGELAGASR